MTDERNERAEAAKANDDSAIIDSAERGPAFGGSSGGNLQRDLGSQAEDERVRDPEAREGVDKTDKIDHAEASIEPRTGSSNSGGGEE